MSKEINYTVVWKINPGSLNAFKELVGSIITMVNKNKPLIKGCQ